MPRDNNGNYTLPAGNPVASGTTVTSAWANDTMNDLANEMSDSLSRQGKGGFTGPVSFISGDNNNPGIRWIDEGNTGFYRAATNDMRAVVAGADIARFTAAGFDTFVGGSWQPVPPGTYFRSANDHAQLWGGATPALRAQTTDDGLQVNGTVFALVNSAATSANLYARNSEGGVEVRADSGNASISTTLAAGTSPEVAASFARGAGFIFRHAGAERLDSVGGDAVRIRGDATSAVLQLATADGASTFGQQLADGSKYVMRAGTGVEIRLERNGGDEALTTDGAGNTILYGANTARVVVAAAAVDNSFATVEDGDSVPRAVGHNVMVLSPSGTKTITDIDNGRRLRPNSNATYTLDSNSLPTTGGTMVVSPTGGTVTITPSGVTLNWFTGSAIETGPRTIAAGGWVTISRANSGNYDIAGSGIS